MYLSYIIINICPFCRWYYIVYSIGITVLQHKKIVMLPILKFHKFLGKMTKKIKFHILRSSNFQILFIMWPIIGKSFV